MNILITGGAGYIGSHACLEFLNAGHQITVVDNLSNSKLESLKRVERITGKQIQFYETDILERVKLNEIFSKNKFDAVIHFAGLKAVGESTKKPLEYFQNNVCGTINLCEIMKKHDVKNIIFSSSATVYGDPESVPIAEAFPLSATNPYGRSKLMIEEILRDLYRSDEKWNVVLLRYFNPVGAHKSGKIGENPNGIPNNLMPYISQVAIGKRKNLQIFGDDYPTKDGTGVRDYIHVVDLAVGHLKALRKIKDNSGLKIYNLGTGNGYSVLEMVKAFEKDSHRKIDYKIIARRSGDIAECFADVSLANKELNWKAKRNIDEMCADAWRWQSKNLNGY